MSDTTSESDSDTLYDPPSEQPDTSPTGASGGEQELALDIPKDLADELHEVALHLGLPPTLLASRAIGLICNEIGLVEEDSMTTGVMIQKYQTRLDLMHTLEYMEAHETGDMEEPESGEPEPDEPAKENDDPYMARDDVGWEAVDNIIEEAEKTIEDDRKERAGEGA